MKPESKSHGAPASDFIREVASNERSWNVETVDYGSPTHISGERGADVQAIEDG